MELFKTVLAYFNGINSFITIMFRYKSINPNGKWLRRQFINSFNVSEVLGWTLDTIAIFGIRDLFKCCQPPES